MNRGIYANATGMIATQQNLDVIANNLANLSTVGYKRDAVGFDEALLRKMKDGDRILGELGAGPVIPRNHTVFTVGNLQSTGNPLDLALTEPRGLFAVQVGNDIRYTRDGAFTLNQDRQLVSKDGHPVLDVQNRPITVPVGATLSVGADGTVEMDGQSVGQIGVFDVARQDPTDLGFSKIGGNLYVAQRPVQAVAVRVQSGALEGSNVEAVTEMVRMIALSRGFEMGQRAITSQDETTQRLIQSLSDR